MKLKLVTQNMKRLMKDYLIYSATITMCVGIMFAFLAISFSTSVSKLAENMINLQKVLITLSVLLMIVFSFLINYAMQFIIKRRKKEFGTYMLLGLEKKFIFKMFIIENVGLGFGSFLMGLPLGIFFYQLLKAMIMRLFNIEYQIEFTLSPKAYVLSLLLFCVVYGINAVKSAQMISHMKIKDLIYGSRYNEISHIKNIKTSMVLNFFFILISIASLFLLINGLTQSDNGAFVQIIAALMGLILGVYGIHICIPLLIYLAKKKTIKWRYKGTNIFLSGQITSKINSTTRILSSSSVMLTFALVLLMIGLSLGATYKTNIEYEAPFDITVAIDADVTSFHDVLNYVGTEVNIKDYIEYKIYHANETEYRNIPLLRLSDYNRLRELVGLDAKTISENQFIIHSEAWDVRKKIKEELLRNNKLSLEGIGLASNEQLIFSEPFEQARTNGNQGYIIVVPDYICDNLESDKSRLIISTIEPAPKELKNKLIEYVGNEWYPELNGDLQRESERKITMFISVKSWSVANGLTGLAIISFGAIYISLIFFLIVGTILSLQQSAEDTENRYRFALLIKLGTKEADILKIMKQQIAIYFILPSIIPVILTVIVGLLMNKMLGNFILTKNIILIYVAITLLIFFTVYSCYMILTYKIFKWGILHKQENAIY